MPITADHRKRIMEKAMPLVMMRLQSDAGVAAEGARQDAVAAEVAHAEAAATFDADPTGANRKAVRDAVVAVKGAQAAHKSAIEAQQALAEPAAQFEAMLDHVEILLDADGLEAWVRGEEIKLQEDQIPIMEAGLQRARDNVATLKAKAAEG